MKGVYGVAGTALVIAALLVLSNPALARLTGTDREEFVKSSAKTCSDAIHKKNPNVLAKTIETYCSCMAEAEADMTTAADIEYMDADKEPTKDYHDRVLALAPACNRKAGSK